RHPHRATPQNMRFALSLRKLPDEEIAQRVDAESRVLRLGRFLDRKPRTLSAGERQRGAVAGAAAGGWRGGGRRGGGGGCPCGRSRSPTWTPASAPGSAPSWPSSSTGWAS